MIRKQIAKYVNFSDKIELLVSRAVNISGSEWKRVAICWLLKFFLQVGLIIGGTLLTAFFVEYFGMDQLPKLFIFQGISMIAGVAIFAPIAEMYKKSFINIAILSSSVLFVVLYFAKIWPLAFFGVFIFTLSVIVAQLSITLSLFIEELFSPLESERAFPVIESSEPVGSLAAGLIIVTMLGFNVFEVRSLLLIVAAALFLMFPVLVIFINSTKRIPKLRAAENIHEDISKLKSIRHGFKLSKTIPFLKVLAILIFMQFVVANILEFQFTKAVYAHVSHDGGHASALTHGLGTVHVLISLVLLTMQLFVFSRVLKCSGVAKSIAINPFLSIIAFISMAVNFVFASAVAAKTVFEVTGNLFRNAHQISFFTLKEEIRMQAKEFLEGVSRPIGAICGTVLIIIFQLFFVGSDLDFVLNISLITLGIFMLVLIFKLSEKHTLLARKNLEMQGTPQEKLDAIEVLAQKGHRNASEILVKRLNAKADVPEVQARIIHTLGILHEPSSLPAIINCFNSESCEVQLAAVDSLRKFENLGKHFLTQAFAKYHVIESLKNLFMKTRSKLIQTSIINTLSHIKDADFIPFLLEILKSEDEDIRAEAVFACGLFHDPTVVVFLEKHLEDPSPYVRANAIIALWQFVPLRMKLVICLTKLLESKNEDDILAGIFTLGEIKMHQEKERLVRFLEHENEEIKKHASIALGKIKCELGIPHIIQHIWKSGPELAVEIKNQINNMHPKFKYKINRQLMQTASHLIAEILRIEKTEILGELSETTLKTLLHIFSIVGIDREVMRIKEELDKRIKSCSVTPLA